MKLQDTDAITIETLIYEYDCGLDAYIVQTINIPFVTDFLQSLSQTLVLT